MPTNLFHEYTLTLKERYFYYYVEGKPKAGADIVNMLCSQCFLYCMFALLVEIKGLLCRHEPVVKEPVY